MVFLVTYIASLRSAPLITTSATNRMHIVGLNLPRRQRRLHSLLAHHKYLSLQIEPDRPFSTLGLGQVGQEVTGRNKLVPSTS
jgi:hypothetical protein